jgi:hypothetical protein
MPVKIPKVFEWDSLSMTIANEMLMDRGSFWSAGKSRGTVRGREACEEFLKGPSRYPYCIGPRADNRLQGKDLWRKIGFLWKKAGEFHAISEDRRPDIGYIPMCLEKARPHSYGFSL